MPHGTAKEITDYLKHLQEYRLELRLLNWQLPLACGCVGCVEGTMPVTLWRYVTGWLTLCKGHGILSHIEAGFPIVDPTMRESQLHRWMTPDGQAISLVNFEDTFTALIQAFRKEPRAAWVLHHSNVIPRSALPCMELVEATGWVDMRGLIRHA